MDAAPGSFTGSDVLDGLPVVVTRPAAQAETLCRLLDRAGARVVRFPTLAIVAPGEPAARDAVLEHFDRFDLAVFVSANAVRHGVAALASRGGLPVGIAVAAVGRATADALRDAGRADVLAPDRGFDSESLLALPAFAPGAVAGRRVVVFRGEGGREHLASTLAARGAAVEYAEVYRRVRAAPSRDEIDVLAARSSPAAVIATSREGLDNLFAIAGATLEDWLRDATFVVVSDRIAARARELGVRRPPLVAMRASDEAMVDALLDRRPR